MYIMSNHIKIWVLAFDYNCDWNHKFADLTVLCFQSPAAIFCFQSQYSYK